MMDLTRWQAFRNKRRAIMAVLRGQSVVYRARVEDGGLKRNGNRPLHIYETTIGRRENA